MAVNEDFSIRAAEESDLPAILAIFNERIVNSTSSFYYNPVSLENRIRWLNESREAGFPILVAVDLKSNGELVRAYASLGTFRDKPAYSMFVTRLLSQLHHVD